MNPKQFLRLRLGRALIVLALPLLALGATALNLAAPPTESVQAINPTELRMHLEFLASKELGGRYTLSPSFAIAARYIASRLQSYGFRGAGENGSYLQPFEVVSARTDAAKTSLTLTIHGKTTLHPYGDFFNLFATAGGNTEGPIVYVGHGISSPSQHHDDYANLDVRGKIVLVVSGTAAGVDPSKLAKGEKDEEAAEAHGAIGVLSVPSRLYWREFTTAAGRARLMNRENIHLAEVKAKKIPVVSLSPALADELLAELGTTTEQLNSKGSTNIGSKPLSASAKLSLVVNDERSKTQNVVAILDGTDPKLKSEYVVFSAHYDHLKTDSAGAIYPGADDDGSGTSSVLAIAHALSLRPPKRSVLVIFHAGEELGLLGSEYNADFSPVVPLADTVVDLNIDMIGRSRASDDNSVANAQLTDANTIYPVGADRISSELNQIQTQTNNDFEKLKFDYTLNDPSHPDQIYFRSDHWNYAKHGVPIIFYFDGVSVDYHQPTDTIEKIDFNKMTRVARLAYEIGWRIANLDHRLRIDHPEISSPANGL